MVGRRRQQRRVQVAAVDDPVRRAVIALRVTDGDAGDVASIGRPANANALRGDDPRQQTVLKTEPDQNAGRIGRELNPGSGFLEARRLFQHAHPEAGLRQRKRRGQSADTGARNDDRGCRSHGASTSCDASRRGRVSQCAFRGPRLEEVEFGVVTIEGRAVGADDFLLAPHIQEDVRMVEGRQCADAHEALGADLDDGDAQIVMEMGNRVFCHDYILANVDLVTGRFQARTIAGKRCNS